jgi:uncharacterized protein (DUF1015 family)
LTCLRPLRGIRYNPEHVRLGGVLAPPYDVISPAQREELYGRDLRNVARIDFGLPYPEDVAEQSDVYTRAAAHLQSWLELGILVRDEQPGLYLVAHEFVAADGTSRRRLGLMGRVPALPWERSEVRPHELTLRGPKEDRLALMRATRAQTSPVWLLWDRAPGLGARLAEIAEGRALLGGRFDGEMGPEKVLLWQVSDPAALVEIGALLDPATLYIADGHHRFETMAAYAAERRKAGDGADADSQFALVYASAAADTALVVLPIHRLVRPRSGLPISREELLARLGGAWKLEPVGDPVAALARLGERRAAEHAYVLVAPDGTAVLRRPRRDTGSRRDALDVSVLQSEVISGCGIGEAELRESALDYTRDPADAVAAVRDGRAGLAFLVYPCTSREVMAVADARENMPQKSTYFYPKVPTGLVISPL